MKTIYILQQKNHPKKTDKTSKKFSLNKYRKTQNRSSKRKKIKPQKKANYNHHKAMKKIQIYNFKEELKEKAKAKH